MSLRILITCALLCGVHVVRGAEGEEAVTVFERVSPSVVGLESVAGSGTGILLSKDGVILTNAHVVAVPLPFKCLVDVTKNGKTETVTFSKVKVVGAHPKFDLAIVTIDPSEHPGITLRPATLNKTPPKTGQRVYAIGNPGNQARVKLTKTVTSGLLSGTDRVIDDVSYLQISAPINPGNSGGPLVDRAGKVIGVVTLKLTDVENVGFALPITELKPDEFKPLRERVASPEKAAKLIDASSKVIAEVNRLQARGLGKSPQAELYRLLAIQILHEALLLDSANGTVYSAIAGLLESFGEQEQAEAYYLAGLETSPWGRDSRIYRNFGLHLLRRNKPEDALAVWGEGLAKHPHSAAQIWEDCSILYRDRRDWNQASRSGTATVLLNERGTRVDLAREIRRLALENLPSAQAECDQMGEELFRRTLVRNALLASGRSVLTPAFAELIAKKKWTLPKGEIGGAIPFPMESPRVQNLLTAMRNGFGPEWKSDSLLTSPESGTTRRDAQPSQVPEEYDLLLCAERLTGTGGLTVGMVVRGEPTAVVLDYNRSISGVAGVKDPLYRVAVFPEKQPIAVVVQVRKSGLRFRVNEREVLAVTTALPKPPEQWNGSAPADWFLGTHQSAFVIHGWWLIQTPDAAGPSEAGNPVLAGRPKAPEVAAVSPSSLTPRPTTPSQPITPSPNVTPGTVPSGSSPAGPAGSLGIREIARLNDTGWGVKSLAISPDGRYVAAGKQDGFVWILDVAKNVKVFDTGKMEDFRDIGKAVFSPKGDRLFAGDRKGKIRIWNLRDGFLTLHRDYVGHGGEISCIEISPDGKWALSGSKDERLRLWETETGREQFAWDGFRFGPKACRFLANGDALATDGELLFKINIKEGKAEKQAVKLASYTTQGAAFSPDGAEVAVSDGHEVKRWSTSDFRALPSCKTANEMIWSTHYSADGKRLHTGGRGKLTIFDTASSQPLDTAVAGEFYLQAIAGTPDGKRFTAVGSAAGQPVYVFEAK